MCMQYYKALTSTAEAALEGHLPRDMTTRPLHVAFFACLGQCTAVLTAQAERFDPDGGAFRARPRGAAVGGGSDSDAGSGVEAAGPSSSGGGLGSRSASPARGGGRAAALLRPDSDSDDGALPGPSGRGIGVGGVPGLSDDLRLLLTASNLGFIRSRLMGALTQRFLLVLTGAPGGGEGGGLLARAHGLWPA